MKKIYSLLATVFFLSALGPVSGAQTYESSETDPEKIYLFDSDITVNTNGSITVTENITLNAKHQQINRGIYRDIPVSLKESVQPFALQLDGKKHPFFTERKEKNLRINFGNDDYISRGKHTYTFSYTFTGAIDFYKNYDELYWNVTGNDWNFTIDKARVRVKFPEQVRVQTNGISLYTGLRGSKQNHTEQTAPLTYETTRPLSPKEGLSIAVPFDTGVIQKPSVWRFMLMFFSPAALFALVLLAVLFTYFIITWLAVGRDPFYLAVTQYEPPQGISPAFLRYLESQVVDTPAMACALVHLAMEGYIEIKENTSFFGRGKATITLKKRNTENLPEEEAGLIKLLFASGTDTFELAASNASKWQPVREGMQKLFAQNAKVYIINNSSYIKKAIGLLIMLGVIPGLCLGSVFSVPLLGINFHLAVFFSLLVILPSRFMVKIVLGLLLTAFYSPFWIGVASQSPAALLCALAYLAGMWGMAFYVPLIRNITPAGKELFAYIDGFKKYMKTAEIYRIAASSPLEAERIFCNFLPYAFAFGLENQWMEKFGKILSQATLEKCTACVGGAKFLSKGLSSWGRTLRWRTWRRRWRRTLNNHSGRA